MALLSGPGGVPGMDLAPLFYDDAVSREAARAPRDGMKLVHGRAKKALLGAAAGGKRRFRALDMGCGRGVDLGRFLDLDVGLLVGVDASAPSIEEASSRARRMSWPDRPPTLVVRDLAGDDEVVPRESLGTFDVVSCMFAIHYFFDSMARLDALLGLAAAALAPGGVFVLTFLRGKDVLDALGGGHRVESSEGWSADVSRESGSAYDYTIVVGIRNTIISGGSEECLVSLSELTRRAEVAGLVPAEDVIGAAIGGSNALIPLEDDPHAARFSGKYSSRPSYTSMNVAAAFRKPPEVS